MKSTTKKNKTMKRRKRGEHANLAAVLADINEAVGGAAGEELSLVRVVRLVVAERDALRAQVAAETNLYKASMAEASRAIEGLTAQVEAARTYARQALDYGEDCDATDLLAAMDGAKP